jgi:hypothetical protein
MTSPGLTYNSVNTQWIQINVIAAPNSTPVTSSEPQTTTPSSMTTTITTESAQTPTETATNAAQIPAEYIYAVIAVIVIIVAIAGICIYNRQSKKTKP